MRAIVVKSFYFPTTTEARAAMHMVQDVSVFGSVTIGFGTTGGLDHAAETIENHARIGCKVVWFPAFDAAYCRSGIGRTGGISILDEHFRLKQEARDVLEIAKRHNLVVCNGHMSYKETESLFEEAKRIGIEKMVLTHPLSDTWGLFTHDQILHLADMGAYVEIVFNSMMPRLGALDPADYVDLVKDVGAERMIVGTDLAQCMDPTPAEGMRFFLGTLLQFGCSEKAIEWMAKTNPAKLLDLP